MKKQNDPVGAWLNRPIKRADMAIFVFTLAFLNLVGDVIMFYWNWVW
ncbi:MAG: hypothetical protein AAGJ73_10435 [Pseudomonadota bacterium]